MEGTRRHAPGLDGIRALAVGAVIAYHLRRLDGGLLGVTMFFALSGYLITSILLASMRVHGRLELRTFWLRRARRLLPALFLVLGVVLAVTAIVDGPKLVARARAAGSACLYVANWATIARGDDYFGRFAGPGPLDHLWSLAIEEQFYLLWPLIVWLFFAVGPRGARRPPLPLVVASLLLAAMSSFAMAWLYVPGAPNHTRAYEGTDARAAPMLIGAVAAMLLPFDEVERGGRKRRWALDILGLFGLVGAGLVVAKTQDDSPFLYRGAEPLLATATVAVVIAAAHPATWVGKVLGALPLRWIGARSYGIYLWHLPVVAFVPSTVLAKRPALRDALLVALMIAIAALSHALLEEPIRRKGLVATFFRRGERARRWAAAAAVGPLAICALISWPLLFPRPRDFDTLTSELEIETQEPPTSSPIRLAVATAPLSTSHVGARTACDEVVHVGDSTSLSLMSNNYLPNAEDRLDAQYRAVGVSTFIPEISGGRAIVEKIGDHPSAYEVVADRAAKGYSGCWVFAIGFGDSATIFGNVAALGQRIEWMMKAAGGTPVLWVTIKTSFDKGPYRDAYMKGFNRALLQACARHPNLRVYDWADEVQDDWFLPDRVHPNEIGARERAARIARALSVAFPKDEKPSAECVVHSGS